MGREDLHKNMEDTFSDKEIFQAGDLSAYDCTFLFINFICCVVVGRVGKFRLVCSSSSQREKTFE